MLGMTKKYYLGCKKCMVRKLGQESKSLKTTALTQAKHIKITFNRTNPMLLFLVME